MANDYYNMWSTIFYNYMKFGSKQHKVIKLLYKMFYVRGEHIYITDGKNFVAKTPCEELEVMINNWINNIKQTYSKHGNEVWKLLKNAQDEILTITSVERGKLVREMEFWYPPNFVAHVLGFTIHCRRYQNQLNRLTEYIDPLVPTFEAKSSLLTGFMKTNSRTISFDDLSFSSCMETTLYNLKNFLSCFGYKVQSPQRTTDFYAWCQNQPDYVYVQGDFELDSCPVNLLLFLKNYVPETVTIKSAFETLGFKDVLVSPTKTEINGGDFLVTILHCPVHAEFTIEFSPSETFVIDIKHRMAKSHDFYARYLTCQLKSKCFATLSACKDLDETMFPSTAQCRLYKKREDEPSPGKS